MPTGKDLRSLQAGTATAAAATTMNICTQVTPTANPPRHRRLVRSRPGPSLWCFVLGPCEPLIPLLMFPAATQSVAGIFWVTGVFAVVTVATMLAAVTLGQIGLERLKIPALARFGHTTAGAAMLGCGVAIGWMGL